MGFWEDVRTGVAEHRADRLASAAVNPTSPLDDAYAAPAERVPLYDGPAPRKSGVTVSSSQQEVWNAIANRHPRKFKKALAYVKWLERMERQYGSRIL